MMEHHIHYMWLSGSQYPSYSTINCFRSEHVKDCVNRLFVQAVTLLAEMGQVSLDVLYVDGTKIESVANKYTFVWCKSTEGNKEKLQAKIQNILSQIEEGIAQDNAPEADQSPSPIDSSTLQKGIRHRKKRPIEPEAVFGQMRFNMGYRRFRHRDFDKVQMDFGIFAMAFNLKKLCSNLLKKGLLALFTLIMENIRLLYVIRKQKNPKMVHLRVKLPKIAA